MPHTNVPPSRIRWDVPNKVVTISFLDTRGRLPTRSGLNWGQRNGRDPYQAYLSIKSTARQNGFLPPRAVPFILHTDDNQSFTCVMAQDGHKALETQNDNSELGRYIRQRIGVCSGRLINLNDLANYGRTDFTIIKNDDGTYTLDLSV